MFASLLPKSAPFFQMLLDQNAMLCKIAEQLHVMLDGDPRSYEVNKSIAEIEADADKLHRQISRTLYQSFITPIDREDILRINQDQEECIDGLQMMATRIAVYEMSRFRFPARKVSAKIEEMAKLTTVMLQGLTKRHDVHKTRAFRMLREECDTIVAVGVAECMDLPEDVKPLDLTDALKWVQIYDRLESVLAKLTDLAEDIEEAVLKNV
ncbi:MAG: DUF47 family protein [Desulfovibrio sp.]|nr:DUF47 family protein [Desulfovibrio sp.]